jgi:hypothetical protein
MRKTLPIVFLLLTILTAALDASVTILSRFEPSTVATGEYSAFVITVDGSSTSSLKCELPEVPGLLISATPNVSNQVSVVNGSVSSFVRYIYTVRALKDGTYAIPDFEATLDGDKQTIPGATLTVTKPGDETRDALLAELEMPDSLYVGESANATLHILIRDDLRAVPNSINPKRTGDGFMQEPIDNNTIRQEHVTRGTTQYDGIAVPLRITAISEGSQPFAYDVDAQVNTTRKMAGGIRDIQDPLERMMQQMRTAQNGLPGFDTRLLQVRAEKTIEVKPLPAGAPASFDGAVGSFEVFGHLSSRKTKVGEPVELTVEILGENGFKQVSAPKVEETENWRNYPPTEETKLNDVTGKMLGKRFKYLFSPLKAGDLVTPSARFAFFDPSTGKYVEKIINGEQVRVADVPGINIAAQTYNPAGKKPAKKIVIGNEGFHPISLLDTPARPGALIPPQKQPLFWLAQLLPTALLTWGIIVPIRRRKAERDPLARQRKAFSRTASAAKAKALAAAKKNDAASFFLHARKCLQNAVCARFPQRRPETVSAADLVQAVGSDDANLRREANLIFNGGEAMRYGGVNTPLAELAAKLTATAKQLGVD